MNNAIKNASKPFSVALLLLCVFMLFVAQSAHATEALEVSTAFDWLADTPWFVLATSVVGLFSVIASITPNETDNKIADFFLKLINIIGANVGQSENLK